MLHLKSISTLLRESFSDDWVSDLLGENPNAHEDERREIFLVKRNEIADRFSLCINFSVIEGEFINLDQSEKLIQQAKLELDKIKEGIINLDLTIDEQPDFFSFFDYIINSLDFYHQLLNALKKKLDNSDSYIFSDRESLPKNSNQYRSRLELLYLNCNLQVFDFTLSKNDLGGLIDIENTCNSEIEKGVSNKNILTILKQKAEVLINKILFRIQKDKTDQKFLISRNFDLIDLYPSTIENENPFFEYNSTTERHYNLIDDPRWHKERLQKTDHKLTANDNLNFSDYHFRTKYYKDTKKDLRQLTNLMESFEEDHLKQKSNEFDNRALDICYGYILNNHLSLAIEKKEKNLNELKEFLSKIEKHQDDSGIKNYFPYLKFSTYLIDKIKEEIKSRKDSDLKELLNDLRDNISKLKTCFKWCKNRNFIPFQLPFAECQTEIPIQIDNTAIRPVVFSSFVLPLDYKVIEEKIESCSDQERQIEIAHAKHQLTKLKEDQIQDFQKEIKEKETKYVEILGIFSAISLFAIGSITFFDAGEPLEYKKALLFMLTFAISIASFVGLIKLILSRFKPWIWAALVGCYLLILVLLILQLGNSSV